VAKVPLAPRAARGATIEKPKSGVSDISVALADVPSGVLVGGFGSPDMPRAARGSVFSPDEPRAARGDAFGSSFAAVGL